MDIRKALYTDRDTLSQLHIASIKRLCCHHYTREQLEVWSSVLTPSIYDQALKEKVFLVAVDSQQALLGLGILDVQNKEISAIYIHPDAVGKKIGAKLLNELENIAQNNNIEKIIVNSTLNAEGFYKHHTT